MLDYIKVTFPNGLEKEYPKGIKLINIAKDFQHQHKSEILGAIVNNELKELWKELLQDSHVAFIDRSTSYGNRFYSRSLAFLFIIAAKEVFKGCKVTVEHSLSKGFYCEVHKNLEDSAPLTAEDVEIIEQKMYQLVRMELPFEKTRMNNEQAEELFKKTGQYDKLALLKYREKKYMNVYSCYGYHDYFYGYMVPSTAYLKIFELRFYSPGLILRFPEKNDSEKLPAFVEQKKLFSIFREFEKWGKILEIETVSNLNDAVVENRLKELILTAEGLHEKKIAQIADLISNSKDKKKIVLIAGPSSSGKTTFAQRLAVQLRVNGKRPISISIDDYFKNRLDSPIDENGELDFETIDSIDIETFNDVMTRLIKGELVEVPTYNFHTGMREWTGKKIKIDEDQIIIVEGIHGLNETLTQEIPKENKFKIYISALTHLGIDNYNRIPTSDLRLIRRIVRDFQFRGTDALSTIKRWDSVRKGEDKYIYPFQEEADVMFNSSLVYELCVLKKVALPQLLMINNGVPEYIEAKRLIKFLNYFLAVDTEEIPKNSILQEFLGNSCFR
ncbi:MAG: AAA family ATPase [Clostridiales bacterium GWB2_37_7]|nr:MAG: AAA family ATPase [Clostridiales bacterium GWB2_37_7]